MNRESFRSLGYGREEFRTLTFRAAQPPFPHPWGVRGGAAIIFRLHPGSKTPGNLFTSIAGIAALSRPATASVCLAGAPSASFNVLAINVGIPLNRFGDHDREGRTYVLAKRPADVRSHDHAAGRRSADPRPGPQRTAV